MDNNRNNKNNKTIKPAENYFSDDEIIEQNSDDKEYESDESIDEETINVIHQAILKNSLNDFSNSFKESEPNNKKIINTKQIKNKHSFSLEEFNKKIEKEEKSKQPKKFVSKRAEDRKKTYGFNDDFKPRRQFNPRYPPYNFVHKKKDLNEKININNTTEFPSLK